MDSPLLRLQLEQGGSGPGLGHRFEVLRFEVRVAVGNLHDDVLVEPAAHLRPDPPDDHTRRAAHRIVRGHPPGVGAYCALAGLTCTPDDGIRGGPDEHDDGQHNERLEPRHQHSSMVHLASSPSAHPPPAVPPTAYVKVRLGAPERRTPHNHWTSSAANLTTITHRRSHTR